MKPVWAEIEKELSWLKNEYYDVDDNPILVKKYDIKEYPSFIFLNKKNEEIHREIGQRSKEQLLEIIIKHKDE
jgi:hypothetical protein